MTTITFPLCPPRLTLNLLFEGEDDQRMWLCKNKVYICIQWNAAKCRSRPECGELSILNYDDDILSDWSPEPASWLFKNQSVDKLKRSSLGGRIPWSIDLKIILEAEPNVIIRGIRNKSVQPERANITTTVFYVLIIKLSITAIS